MSYEPTDEIERDCSDFRGGSSLTGSSQHCIHSSSCRKRGMYVDAFYVSPVCLGVSDSAKIPLLKSRRIWRDSCGLVDDAPKIKERLEIEARTHVGPVPS